MIQFSCTNCGKRFAVADNLAGRKAACKGCGEKIRVPDAKTNQQSAPSAQSTANTPDQTTTATAGPHTSKIFHPTGSSAPAPPSTPVPPPLPPKPVKKKPPMRIRRLVADAEMMKQTLRNFPLIKIHKTIGTPPETYQLIYNVQGLAPGPHGEPIRRDGHVVEVQLTAEYPRQSPKCRMLTPVFHPNIEPAMICVGDHWTAGERLIDLVIRIAELIAYQAYNIRSPLDGAAAMWADQNSHLLPVDHRDLHPPD